MMRRPACASLSILFCVAAVLVFAGAVRAAEAPPPKPFLHPLFSSDMVLQRDASDPVWGWAEPGQRVTIAMNGKTATATAGADGKWLAKIGPFPGGGPYELTVSGPKEVKLTNVLVGDVWICSGQSNMEMGIANVTDGRKEVAAADHPRLRLFTVPKHIAYQPQDGFRAQPPGGEQAKWLVCTPKNVLVGDWGGFSAAGYFFGRDLQQHLNVPIGLIHTSWGGTVAEAWTSAEALEQMADFRDAVHSLKEPAKEPGTLAEQMRRWYAKHDPGSADGLGWADPALNDADWKTMKLPVLWEQAGLPDFDGIVWFRREVKIGDSWMGKDLELHLGPIDDRDTTWVNGVRVGGLDAYNQSRIYEVPASAVKGGKLVIAIRVLDTGGGGGIWGGQDTMMLAVPDGKGHAVKIDGEWKYKVGVPLAKAGQPPQSTENNPNVPTVLYNGMVAPLVPFAIKGATWYQGESNAGRAAQYRTLLPTMIRDWRGRFGVGDFPFLIVQLAAFMEESPRPAESQWAELREAQDLTARTVGHSAIAVANDIGEAKDIHPHNKQEVGRRLALAARGVAYGESVEYSGPVFKQMEVKGNQAVLHFDHLGGGLDAKGGPLAGFAVAGADGKFVWADAKVEGDTVVVSASGVDRPAAVRYAWANNPAKANLYNKAGLPAPPFRTDGPK
jgi:sialate O-acetylesterase